MEVSNWMESLEKEKLCTSVFKSGNGIVTKESFTQKWIQLVRRMERDKLTKVSRQP